MLIENSLLVELKSVTEINPIFEAQLLTYMNLLKAPMGLLINFNVKNIFYEGQKTMVNEFYRGLDALKISMKGEKTLFIDSNSKIGRILSGK